MKQIGSLLTAGALALSLVTLPAGAAEAAPALEETAQAAAEASLRDAAYFQERTAQVVRTRQRTALALRDMGFAVTDSQANFLFVRHPQVPAKTLLDGLRERGILVRWFDRPRIRDYLRITVGTDGEMDALTAALKELTEV